MTEALKAHIIAEVLNAVVIKHADAYTAGTPDLSESWGGMTSWLEVKYLNPSLTDDPRQQFLIRKMARATFCKYVFYLGPKCPPTIWSATELVKTCIVDPIRLNHDASNWPNCIIAASPKKHDHELVMAYLRDLRSYK